MKKFLALLVSVVMVMALVAIPAAADGEVVFTASTVENVMPGDDVEIDVTIAGDYEAHTLNMALEYDTTYLEVKQFTNGEVLSSAPGAVAIPDYTTIPGQVKLGVICPTAGLTGSGKLFTVKFHVKDNFSATQTLTLNVTTFTYSPLNGAPENIDYTTVNGAIVIDPSYQPPEPQGNVFAVDSKDVAPGSEVSVNFTLTGEEYAANILNAVLEYDAAKLTVKSAVAGSVISGIESVVIDTATAGKVKLGVISNEAITTYGTYLTVTFQVASTFSGTTTIRPVINQFGYMAENETNMTPVDYTTVNGVLTATDAPAADVTFTMESKENVAPGSEITLNFTVEGEYEAHILNAYLNYDSSVLEFVKAENGAVLDACGENDQVIVENVDGSVRIGVICSQDAISAEGVIVAVTFKVAADFDAPTTIEVAVNEFGYMPVGSTNAEPIAFETVNGVVTPGVGPNPPVTGLASIVGLGIVAISAGAGVVIFRKKED